MEEKSGFDKFFNISQNAVTQKRLLFESPNNISLISGGGMSSKKRKTNDSSAYDVNQSEITIGTLNETSLNSSAGSLSAPWEIKMLRIDLNEAQARNAQLKKEIQHQSTIQSELELKFAAKERGLESEKNQYKNKAEEFEKIVKKSRKNESKLKEELVKNNNQLLIQKQTFDQSLFKLQNENKALKETLNYKMNTLQNTISELTRELKEIRAHYETAEKERQSLDEINQDLISKLDEFKTAKNDLEKERNKFHEASMTIKKLEYELNSVGDWKAVETASLSRMVSMSDLEREVVRLRSTNQDLNKQIGNKMLLEEQVYSLTTRLEYFQKENENNAGISAKLNALEKELADWQKLGVDFVPKGYAPNPINVRSYVEKLLHHDLQLESEKSGVSSEKMKMINEMNELRMKNEALTKQSDSFEKSLKTHQMIVVKLQKKMRIVQSERDSQRQIIENFEKDLTLNPLSAAAASGGTQDTQNRIRIEMLTNSVSGYKELCARLEQENAELRGNPSMSSISDPTFCSNDQYKALRKDMEALRMENEKLRKRKNELEIEIENLTLRNNCVDDDRLKVLHLKNNPASLAQQQIADEVDKLKAEIERLKARNQILEEGGGDLTMRSNETMNMTLSIKDLQKLKDSYAQLQIKYEESEKLFKSINQELREVVYLLFGFKLDRYADGKYKIVSVYADHEHDELEFLFNDEGTLDMLETDYSRTDLLSGLADYLQGPNGSLPYYLAALTIELKNKATVTVT